MAKIDLDAARAARREAATEPIIVTLEGDDFVMPAEMPFEVVEKLGPLRDAGDNAPEAAGALLDLFKALIGDDNFTRFMGHKPSLDDLKALLEGVLAEYGVTLGEAPASTTS